MLTTCNMCGFAVIVLPGGILICRRCDTTAVSAGMRAGPPNMPDTQDGRFNAPFRDK